MEPNQSGTLEAAQVESTSAGAYNIDVISTEETTDIPEIHRGTVDNPFLYDAGIPELEKFILVNMFVAGKNASIQQLKLDQFVDCVRRDLGDYVVDTLGVLSAINNCLTSATLNDTVLGWLKEVKAGQYTRLTTGIIQLAEYIGAGKLDLKKCTRGDLVRVKGIGWKTASMFLLYTRRNAKTACLDTHILKYLREEAAIPDVPLTTPTIKSDYIRLEAAFLEIVRLAGKTVAEFDFEIWSRYRQKVNHADITSVQKSTVVITEEVATASA
jgi:hypothetical protein